MGGDSSIALLWALLMGGGLIVFGIALYLMLTMKRRQKEDPVVKLEIPREDMYAAWTADLMMREKEKQG